MHAKPLLLASLLVLGAVAVAPTASADHVACASPSPIENTCGVAAGVANILIHYVECYLFTPIIGWPSCL